MSLTSLYTGISGLDAYSRAMSVIGNNLANLNTVGYKASRIGFEDILSQSLVGATGRLQIGRGVQVASVQRLFSQATFQTTSAGTDLAIDGDGFFVVAKDGTTQYTRAGQFYMNEDGQLINHRDYALQGWMLDEDGSIASNIRDINLSTISSAPVATTALDLHVNLDANYTEFNDATDPWDNTDPLATSNYSTSLTVYDTVGNAHLMTFYFRKDDTMAAGEWGWYALMDDGEFTGGTPGNVRQVADGSLTFNNGRLQNETITTAFSEEFAGTNGNQDIDLDFGVSTGEGGSGLDGSTQFAGGYTTKFLGQDGYNQGNLLSIQIDDDGTISGMFSNGRSRKVYQLALSRFTSPWGLSSIGGNLFSETSQSGPPIVGIAGSSGLGTVMSNSLELSNVDMATEFVEMIKTQQAFQANSRIITTTDQMLQELVNLKR